MLRKYIEDAAVGCIAERDDQEQLGSAISQVCSREVAVLCDHHATIMVRERDDVGIRCRVAPYQVAGVDRVMSLLAKPRREPWRQLRIDEELHAANLVTTFTRASRAAQASAAVMSCGSK